MYNSKYKSQVDKIKRIGINIQNNETYEEANDKFKIIMNATIFRKMKKDIIESHTIEAILQAIKKKHGLYIGYVLPLIGENDNLAYSFSLRFGNEHVDTVFARTMEEGLYKSVLVLYYYIKLKGDKANE